MQKRTVFFVSDGTGITAEVLGHSLLTQFGNISFEQSTIPYVNTEQKAHEAIALINQTGERDGHKPIIFATIINDDIRRLIEQQCSGMLMDFFKTFIGPLEAELDTRSSHSVGRTHGLIDYNTYQIRIDAVNYALAHDDGLSTRNYGKADIILVGVSRCGKTPTCLYLALQFGIFAANYPFVEDDMERLQLPEALKQYRNKLFGLTIDAERLQAIRNERRPNSKYASIDQCKLETEKVEQLFRQEKIAYLSSTTRSIEEIATTILATMKVKRRLF